MATTPEGQVKKDCKRLLSVFGKDVYFFMPVTGGYGVSGVPDIVCCAWGKFLAIECKAGHNTTTALQDRELDAIRSSGGRALVINEHNIADLGVLLAAWKNEYGNES